MHKHLNCSAAGVITGSSAIVEPIADSPRLLKARPADLGLTTHNRRNAKNSTGPRTRQGKQLAAQNALQHGLTANPAAGTPEDAEAFTALLVAVAVRLMPADVIEDALIHRIAFGYLTAAASRAS